MTYNIEVALMRIADVLEAMNEKLTEPSQKLPSGQRPCSDPSLQGASEGQMTQEQFVRKHGAY